MTQLVLLLKKDLRALFKQKAVVASLLIPMFLMISFGAIPLLSGIEEPFEVAILNEDGGFGNITLGNSVQETMESYFGSDETLKLKVLNNFKEFVDVPNGVWFPSNFTEIGVNISIATYFMKLSNSNLRAESIMLGIVQPLIEQVVTRELLKPTPVPQILYEQVYDPSDVSQGGEIKDRGKIAFPLAYMVFLLLILSGSSIRSTGFTNEKNSGMMELLLASIKNRRDLILSKLITGLIYGFLTVLSYIAGGFIGLKIGELGEPTDDSVTEIFFSSEIVKPLNLFYIFAMFILLIFTSVQILLFGQLWLGKDAGDRIGSMITMIFSFAFYFSVLNDPLSKSIILVLNPFYWPYRMTLNLIFEENFLATVLYFAMNLIFSYILLQLKIDLIQKEKVIFE